MGFASLWHLGQVVVQPFMDISQYRLCQFLSGFPFGMWLPALDFLFDGIELANLANRNFGFAHMATPC